MRLCQEIMRGEFRKKKKEVGTALDGVDDDDDEKEVIRCYFDLEVGA